jgi:hypothetical protein
MAPPKVDTTEPLSKDPFALHTGLFLSARKMRSTLSFLKKQLLWAGGVAQVVECLPRKCEVLSSDPSTAKKKKKKISNSTFFFPGPMSLKTPSLEPLWSPG